MNQRDFSVVVSVEQTPEEVFEAIKNVRGWWTGDIEGSTEKLGDEFSYRYKSIHYSKQKLTELVPGKKVVWLVLEARLDFTKDKTEWNATKLCFDIGRKGNKTEVRFTHVGLTQEAECYEACSGAWTSLVTENLRRLIGGGKGQESAAASSA